MMVRAFDVPVYAIKPGVYPTQPKGVFLIKDINIYDNLDWRLCGSHVRQQPGDV